MGFRDDDQAARARADALQRELAERERELDEREAELRQAQAALTELGAQAKAGEAAQRRESEREARGEQKRARAHSRRKKERAQRDRSSWPQKTSLCQSADDSLTKPTRPLQRGKGDIVFNAGIWIVRMVLSLALGLATFLGLSRLWQR